MATALHAVRSRFVHARLSDQFAEIDESVRRKKREKPLFDSAESKPSMILIPLPEGKFHAYWQRFIIPMTLFSMILTPLQFGFQRKPLRPSDPLELLNLAFDFVFMFDIALTMNTAYYTHGVGTLVTDRYMILCHYAKSGLLVDMLSSIPSTYLVSILSGGMMPTSVSLARLPRILRMLKLARSVKMMRLMMQLTQMNAWDADSSVSVIVHRFLRLVFLVLITAHLAACVFARLAEYRGYDNQNRRFRRRGWGGDNWVAHYFNDGNPLYHGDRSMDVDQDWTHTPLPTGVRLYVVAIYWAFTTLTTVGYGDVLPISNGEILWTITVQFVGTCILGYVMSDVTAMLSRENIQTVMIREKIRELNSYMAFRRLPGSIVGHVRQHYTYLWQQTSVFDEHTILTELPEFLRSEICLYTHRSLLRSVKFLADMPSQLVTEMCVRCEPQVTMQGDDIVTEGEEGTWFYIISEGLCQLLLHRVKSTEVEDSGDMLLLTTLDKGGSFAEYTLFENEALRRHPFTVRGAGAPVELLALSRNSFLEISVIFPHVRVKMAELADARCLELADFLVASRRLTIVKKGAMFNGEPSAPTPWADSARAACALARAAVTCTKRRRGAVQIAAAFSEALSGAAADATTERTTGLASFKGQTAFSERISTNTAKWSKRAQLETRRNGYRQSISQDDHTPYLPFNSPSTLEAPRGLSRDDVTSFHGDHLPNLPQVGRRRTNSLPKATADLQKRLGRAPDVNDLDRLASGLVGRCASAETTSIQAGLGEDDDELAQLNAGLGEDDDGDEAPPTANRSPPPPTSHSAFQTLGWKMIRNERESAQHLVTSSGRESPVHSDENRQLNAKLDKLTVLVNKLAAGLKHATSPPP